MPLPGFEWLCVALVTGTLAVMARRRPVGGLVADYLALAVAGWVGEATCIAAYGFYGYAPSWHLRAAGVPVLVPLIWPLVILSAREVVGGGGPGGRGRWWRPLAVGLVVALDASLVEVVAVRAGLWAWAEPGHLGVPVIGILGWGYFGLAADAVLRLRTGRRRLLLPAAAPLGAHALILATWWGLFRWTARGALGWGSVVGMAALGAGLVPVAILARRRGHGMPAAVAAPRVLAALLFLAVLLRVAPADAGLWIQVAAVSAPYVAMVTRTGSAPASERAGRTAA